MFFLFSKNKVKGFRESSWKKIYFARCLGALARPGSRELRAVEIPASYGAWQPPKRRKNFSEKLFSNGIEAHAGHGLNYETTKIISTVNEIEELNIGFFISANFTMINKKLELYTFKR